MNNGKLMSVFKTRVTLAVQLIDGETEKVVNQEIATVSLTNNKKINYLWHKDGFYLYLDLKDGNYTLKCEATGYDTDIRSITIPREDHEVPLEEVFLNKV